MPPEVRGHKFFAGRGRSIKFSPDVGSLARGVRLARRGVAARGARAVNVQREGRRSSMSEGLKAVFIAGGAGTRLWPLSRESRPKQFHALADDGASLMRQTVERVLPVVAASDVWVVTGERYV